MIGILFALTLNCTNISILTVLRRKVKNFDKNPLIPVAAFLQKKTRQKQERLDKFFRQSNYRLSKKLK